MVTLYNDPYDNRPYPDNRGYPESRDIYDDRRDYAPPQSPEPTSRAPPPVGTPKPKRVSYKCFASMIVVIVGLVLIFVFMSFPWYQITYTADYEDVPRAAEFKLQYDLDELSGEVRLLNDTVKNSTPYDHPDIKDQVEEVNGVMDYIFYFFLAGIILIIIAIVIIPIVALGKMPHSIGMIILILGIIFVLIIPIYFYFTFPSALEKHIDRIEMPDPYNKTFTGSNEFLGKSHGTDYDIDDKEIKWEMEWGPEMGFWFVFVPLIILVIAQVIYSLGKDELRYGYVPGGPRPPPPRGPPRGEREPVSDYGSPRPMREEGYDYIPPPRTPGPERGYDYQRSAPPQAPPPPRRRDYGGSGAGYGYDRRQAPPPPRRPPRRRYQY